MKQGLVLLPAAVIAGILAGCGTSSSRAEAPRYTPADRAVCSALAHVAEVEREYTALADKSVPQKTSPGEAFVELDHAAQAADDATLKSRGEAAAGAQLRRGDLSEADANLRVSALAQACDDAGFGITGPPPTVAPSAA